MDEINGKDFEIHESDSDVVEQYKEDEERFLINITKSNIDVLDENLYCYDSSVFSLSLAIQNRTSEESSNRLLRMKRQQRSIFPLPFLRQAYMCRERQALLRLLL